MTGQVIDVASEVFEVDAAGDDDDLPVKYSGYVAVIASVAGTLLGIGSRYGSDMLTVVYAFGGAGSIVVVPELLRTLVFARPCGGDQFAAGTVSPSLDMSR